MSASTVGGTSIGSTSAATRSVSPRGRVRRTVASLAVLGLLWGGTVLAAPASGRPSPAEAAGISVRVCVSLAVRATTRRVVLGTLEDEIARIWRLNGVEVVYARAENHGFCPEAASRTLVLWVLDSAAGLPPGIVVRGPALGAVLAPEGAPQNLVFVFVAAAEQWVADRGWQSALIPVHFSTFLARVAAHEMGHALLHRSSHSDLGLMRAQFGKADLRLPESHGFLLERGERLALQSLAATQVATAWQGGAGSQDPSPRR